MKRPDLFKFRLFHTLAVRLALRYALLYALVLGLASTLFYAFTSRQVDSRMEADMQTEFASLSREFATPTAIARAIQARTESGREPGHFYLLLSSSNKVLAGNLAGWPDETELPLDGRVHRVWIDETVFPRGRYEDEVYLPVIAQRLANGSRLLLARGIEQSAELHALIDFLVEVMGVVILLATVMAVSLSRSILGRMDTIGRAADEIMVGDLSQRIPLSKHKDEFDALAARLNAMLERIQQLIQGIREVTDNTAHDMRSPLTRLRNRLEVALLQPRDEQAYRQAISNSIEDLELLIKTFNTLLSISQAEAGNHRSQWCAVELDRLVADLIDLYLPLAEEKGLTLELSRCEHARIIGNRDLLAQALGNLLENATKFTPDKGTIRLEVRVNSAGAEIVVSDTGPGIPAAERSHVLERFVRLERSRHTPGNGLGLSLVNAVVKLHKAELRLEDANPGLKVTIRFAPVQHD